MAISKVTNNIVKSVKKQITFKFPKKKPKQVQLTFRFPKSTQTKSSNKLDKLA